MELREQCKLLYPDKVRPTLHAFLMEYHQDVWLDFSNHLEIWEDFVAHEPADTYYLFKQLKELNWDRKKINKVIEEASPDALMFELDDPKFQEWIDNLKAFLTAKIREEGFTELL